MFCEAIRKRGVRGFRTVVALAGRKGGNEGATAGGSCGFARPFESLRRSGKRGVARRWASGGAASDVDVERVLSRMREVVAWRGVDLHAAPLREARRDDGAPIQA